MPDFRIVEAPHLSDCHRGQTTLVNKNLGNKKGGPVSSNLIGSDGVIRYPRGIFLDFRVAQASFHLVPCTYSF